MATAIQKQTDSWFKRAYKEFSYSMVNAPSLGAYLEPLIQPINPLWSAEGYRALVADVRDESDTCFTLVLEPNKNWTGFKPGQFVELKVNKDGAEISRCFSISSSVQQFDEYNQIELTIRIQEQGRITPWLRENLRPSNIVGLSAAMGDFVVKGQRPVLMIAGGSGITPFRSYMNSQANIWPRQKASLMYYASNIGDHLFAREFEHLGNTELSDTYLISTKDRGRFNIDHLQQCCPNYAEYDVYICGPNAMIEHVTEQLQCAGVNAEHIHIEHFGPTPSNLDNVSEGGLIHFQNAGKQISVENADTLLNVAEQNNIPAKSGCRMGVCHQCKCRKSSGVVYNTLTNTYSDTGQEEIQLCVSVPVGEVTLEL